MGTKRDERKARAMMSLTPRTATMMPAAPPEDRKHDALSEGLANETLPRRSHGKTKGCLRAASRCARQQEICNIGAGNEQHERTHGKQDAQAVFVAVFHLCYAGASRNHVDVLFGQNALDLRKILRILRTKIIYEPLPRNCCEPRSQSIDLGARTQTANDPQPGVRLLQECVLSREQRLLIEWQKDLRWIASQRLTVKIRRSYPHDSERISIEHESGSDDLRIRTILLLPDTMAQHGRRLSRWLVVRHCECAPGEGLKTKRGEVIA